MNDSDGRTPSPLGHFRLEHFAGGDHDDVADGAHRDAADVVVVVAEVVVGVVEVAVVEELVAVVVVVARAEVEPAGEEPVADAAVAGIAAVAAAGIVAAAAEVVGIGPAGVAGNAGLVAGWENKTKSQYLLHFLIMASSDPYVVIGVDARNDTLSQRKANQCQMKHYQARDFHGF